MTEKALYPAIAFLVVLVGHATYSIWDALRVAGQWVQVGGNSSFAQAFIGYFKDMDVMLGISYALSAAFTIYAFQRLREGRTRGVAGMLGGATLTGLLYFGGCFLIGCCGSPMLVVYLNLFGASFLGFTKPIILALTAISIMLGYFWMERKTKAGTCDCADET